MAGDYEQQNETDGPEDILPEPEDEGGTQDRVRQLQAEFDDLNAKYLRTLADYQNSQRRAGANEREARQQGITGVVLSVLPVMDNFDLALTQDPSTTSPEQIVHGVKVIRDELSRVLQGQGVTPIIAEPNTPFDPQMHQAVVQQPMPGVKPGNVVATLQTGYRLGDRVIRPAKVSVAPGQG